MLAQPFPRTGDASDDYMPPLLIAHIALMSLVFVLIYPLGLLAGISKSKLHIPLQILGTLIFIPAYIMGHNVHVTKPYVSLNPHKWFAWVILGLVAVQALVGLGIKFAKRVLGGRIRRFCLGFIGVTRDCGDDNLGNCLAHYIMGGFFLYYGCITLLRFTFSLSYNQELIDSFLIFIWGLVNANTLHHPFNERWNEVDRQHTMLGVLYISLGFISLVVEFCFSSVIPNIFPFLTIGMTGVAFASHAQHSHLSSGVHIFVGYALMIASTARVYTVITRFSAKERKVVSPVEIVVGVFMNIAGILFTSSNYDFMTYFGSKEVGMDHVTYSLAGVSIAVGFAGYVLCLAAVYSWLKGKRIGGGGGESEVVWMAVKEDDYVEEEERVSEEDSRIFF
ncbi:hypothetical protein HK098_008081 [Nowakowskiella sp. JEL0407]|nr:hypothetical protein HK098_008081 [Nowakowskiella sp. JEL0407]